MSENEKLLRFLYETAPGRLLLKPLVSRFLSEAAGRFLDTPLSKPLIRPFLKAGNIDLNEYLPETYGCFNDCFTRRIRPKRFSRNRVSIFSRSSSSVSGSRMKSAVAAV